MRKALCHHFGRADMQGLGAFFDSFEQARQRHISMLDEMQPNRTRYSLTRKVAKNLGLSDEEAGVWVDRFHEIGRLPNLR
ncbi:hypothetical protein [Jannaschia pohangensis]|uniref:Uncharacterized protein n=1 Tax=Jannaschia pohangensis TaxID=390807 RepID=A0A1I3IGZ5_9RHOB|nr:hypothetical protein [Jannaschia pohangensis]SFI47201.1 hypothetical protein SAMN04488095_0965 [Jannaschia pohangensis]